MPSGAKAGDLALRPCQFNTDTGTRTGECGTLVVPENHANPQSRLIALPVVRLRARTSQPGEPVFYLEGGPGITNVAFKQADRYA
ncbi:MAG TPA: hypothetical protein VFX41_04425, partial [Actinomycetales bacterium]|nr:hypothetical protein [Actinomycetales bacterium]